MSTRQKALVTSSDSASKQRGVDDMAAVAKQQGTVAVATSHVGYIPGTPGAAGVTYRAAIAAANVTRAADILAAEQARQSIVAVAKDLLRSQGEIAF